MPKQLLIAIDPGFDSMKVIANGKGFKFPFNAVETDERKMSDYGPRDGFILYKDENGATWRVGQFARSLIFEKKAQKNQAAHLQDFYSEERFVSSEMLVGIRSAIAKAILDTGLYGAQSDLDIRLIVALPHAIRTKYMATVIGLLAGEQSFYMTLNSGKERRFHFTIKETNIYTVSQTIAAILGETSDDSGFINEEMFFYLSGGPTLVIDGGYYTIGLVPISRGGSVDDSRAESDTMHAMKNVNMEVSKALSQYRNDIEHYSVEFLLSQGETGLRHLKDGKVVTIDLAKLRTDKIQAVCKDFIAYINTKYNNLLDFKYVLVTGGTGACYFKQMLAYYKELGLMDEHSMLLTVPRLNDMCLPIEFAIAVGAYKGLRGKLA